MKKPLLLFLFSFLLNLAAFSQQTPFEQQYVVMADGREALLWIHLDEQSELLHYKVNESDKAEVYAPAAIISFLYGGHQYYSLPLREGYFTFFKVHHEGGEFAVLEKTPNYKILRILVDDSGGAMSLCQNRRSHEFYLCIPDKQSNRIPNSQFYNYGNSVREYEVRKLVYLAIEGKLKLFYMETNDRFSFWDDILNHRPGHRKSGKMLEDFIDDPQKRAAIQLKVQQDKLDIRNPQQLIQALEAVYQ